LKNRPLFDPINEGRMMYKKIEKYKLYDSYLEIYIKHAKMSLLNKNKNNNLITYSISRTGIIDINDNPLYREYTKLQNGLNNKYLANKIAQKEQCFKTDIDFSKKRICIDTEKPIVIDTSRYNKIYTKIQS